MKGQRKPKGLEKQLAKLGPRPTWSNAAEPWMGADVEAKMRALIAWERKRAELLAALDKRDNPKVRDPGPDESGNYDVSPFVLAQGHVAEVAPQELRASEATSFPRRIVTQRCIDRYRVHRVIDDRQWKAADRLYRDWVAAGRNSLVSAAYAPRLVDGGTLHPERRMIGRTGAVIEYEAAISALGRIERSCVRAVVVDDMAAGDWARTMGVTHAKASKTVGTFTLRGALDSLVDHYGY